MGKALFRKSGFIHTGDWSNHGSNAHDPATHIDVETRLPPNVRKDRWDGATGIRAATAQEISDFDTEEINAEATRVIDNLKGFKSLAAEILIEINALRTNAGLPVIPGATWRQRLIDRYKGL